MVIKRVLLSIMISLLLLVSVSGVTVVQHYCQGKLMAESIYSTPHHCCGDSCPYCSDKVVSLRVSDTFLLSANHFDFDNNWMKVMDHFITAEDIKPLFTSNFQANCQKEVPPLIVLQPALSKIQVYRI